jgi:hypothetical protein
VNKLIGVLLIIGGVVAGVYAGFWLCFVGGILDIVHGFKADPTNDGQIVWGFIKALVLPETVGVVVFVVIALIGAIFLGWEKTPRRRARLR